MSNADTATNTNISCACGTSTTPMGTKRFALAEDGHRYDIVDATDAQAAMRIAIANFHTNEYAYTNGDRIDLRAYEIDGNGKYIVDGDQITTKIEVTDGLDPEDEDGAEEEQM